MPLCDPGTRKLNLIRYLNIVLFIRIIFCILIIFIYLQYLQIFLMNIKLSNTYFISTTKEPNTETLYALVTYSNGKFLKYNYEGNVDEFKPLVGFNVIHNIGIPFNLSVCLLDNIENVSNFIKHGTKKEKDNDSVHIIKAGIKKLKCPNESFSTFIDSKLGFVELVCTCYDISEKLIRCLGYTPKGIDLTEKEANLLYNYPPFFFREFEDIKNMYKKGNCISDIERKLHPNSFKNKR